ncbi:class F sortase [Streptomyces sp. NRRL S-474]|uniref:class F sortase n=1 Tax=Streptomyces sp. NRRL S-474 TaxID=1463909 RepID=UPI0004C7F643|nr:class F sortase [Streptomyces sp. NRRL S-474]
MRREVKSGHVTAPGVRRRRARRPWYRRRAYRLTRTIVVAVSVLMAMVWWDRGGESGRAATALPPSSAGAAVAVPGESGDDRAAVPGGSTDVTARPRRSRAPEPHTGTSWAPASRPATPPAHGSEPSGTPTARPSTAAGDARHQQPTTAPEPNHTPTRTPTSTPTTRSPRPPASLRPLPPSRATRLLIPYLRIDAPVMHLGLDRDHRLTAPPEDDAELVGWFKHGASPGGQGTAVAVGHLDTDSGPAVFAGLTEMKPDRVVEVRRADGRIAVYTVDRVRSYEKANFPSQEVYGPRGRPELRLITCSGTYDRRKGYSGNLVVFAHLTGIR